MPAVLLINAPKPFAVWSPSHRIKNTKAGTGTIGTIHGTIAAGSTAICNAAAPEPLAS